MGHGAVAGLAVSQREPSSDFWAYEVLRGSGPQLLPELGVLSFSFATLPPQFIFSGGGDGDGGGGGGGGGFFRHELTGVSAHHSEVVQSPLQGWPAEMPLLRKYATILQGVVREESVFVEETSSGGSRQNAGGVSMLSACAHPVPGPSFRADLWKSSTFVEFLKVLSSEREQGRLSLYPIPSPFFVTLECFQCCWGIGWSRPRLCLSRGGVPE